MLFDLDKWNPFRFLRKSPEEKGTATQTGTQRSNQQSGMQQASTSELPAAAASTLLEPARWPLLDPFHHRKSLLHVLSFAAFLALSIGSQAQEHLHGHDFHGRDFGHFSPAERSVWQGGRWVHDWHDGRYGWWWTVGGFWYFYPEPVYPYPTYVPPAVVVQQAPPAPTGLPPAQSWYYCDNPQGYYPYVASCNGTWHAVPATPASHPQQ
jgi:hypothetical protein